MILVESSANWTRQITHEIITIQITLVVIFVAFLFLPRTIMCLFCIIIERFWGFLPKKRKRANQHFDRISFSKRNLTLRNLRHRVFNWHSNKLKKYRMWQTSKNKNYVTLSTRHIFTYLHNCHACNLDFCMYSIKFDDTELKTKR